MLGEATLQRLTDWLGLRVWRWVRCSQCGCQVAFRGREGDDVRCGACGAALPGLGAC